MHGMMLWHLSNGSVVFYNYHISDTSNYHPQELAESPSKRLQTPAPHRSPPPWRCGLQMRRRSTPPSDRWGRTGDRSPSRSIRFLLGKRWKNDDQPWGHGVEWGIPCFQTKKKVQKFDPFGDRVTYPSSQS